MRTSSDGTVVLSLSEGLSLLYVGTTPEREDLPETHATKLMEMGLTEISDGRFAYTGFGRQVADRMAMFGGHVSRLIH